MPQGAQFFDQYGNLTLDLGDRIGRWLFTIIIPPYVTGSLSHPGLSQGTPIPFARMFSLDALGTWPADSLYAPVITFSGNTMAYTGGPATHRVQVWVY